MKFRKEKLDKRLEGKRNDVNDRKGRIALNGINRKWKLELKTSILILLNPAKKIFFHLFHLSFFDKKTSICKNLHKQENYNFIILLFILLYLCSLFTHTEDYPLDKPTT